MWLGLVAGLLFCAQAAAPAAPAPAGAKGWIGRQAEFEQYLKTAPIKEIKDVGSGVTRPRRATFSTDSPFGRAIVKNLRPGVSQGYWESYRSEIAAYELDKILGLDMVPPTVERRIEGDLQSAQMWVEGCRLLRTVQGESAPDTDRWNRQVWRQRVFDNLAANIDRNSGNLLIDSAWNLILIDHSRAFTSTRELPFGDKMERVDRAFFEKVKTLDEAVLRERLLPWLRSRSELAALLVRRELVVQRLEKLARERGESGVFVP
jgi:hypothetical protein